MPMRKRRVLRRIPWWKRSPSKEGEIAAARELMLATYRQGGKILVLGNGGSAADADHIVGELMKGFLLRRPMTEEEGAAFTSALGEEGAGLASKLQRGIPAISLPAQSAVLSAYANDVDPALVYAQLVYGYGKKGDLVIALSTSGNSKNAVEAVKTARALGIATLGFTGEKESALSRLCDVTLRAPSCETYRVQEYHLPLYHYLCAAVEEALFGPEN